MRDNRWLILAALFLARTAMGFQFQTVASTAPLLMGSLRIDYTQTGTLIGLYMLPGVIMALPGGVLGQRFGDKRICTVGLALMIGGGLAFVAAGSYATAAAGRLVSGAGAVLFSLAITKMVTDWFAGREIVTAMSVMLASWPCGIAVALVTQPWIAERGGWPAVMGAAVAFCAIALLLIGALYRAPPALTASSRPQAAGTVPPAGPALAEHAAAATAGLAWGVFNVGFIVFFSFTPALLAEHGQPAAAALTSLGLWASMPSLPLGGFLAERSGHPRAAIVLFSCAAGIVLLSLTRLWAPAALCLLLGVAIGPAAGAIMALPAQVLRPARRALGFGVFYTLYYAVMAIGPAIAGAFRDHWDTAAAALLFGAAAFWSVPPLLLAFRAAAALPGLAVRRQAP